MTTSNSIRIGATLAIGAGFLLMAQYAYSQRGPGRGMGAPLYDTSTVMTVQGTVQEVKTLQGRRGFAGNHLILKTDDAAYDVHLGPASYVKDQGFNFKKGDQIEVTGSKLKFSGGESIIAREVKMGGKTLALRDEQGIPLWPRGRGR